MAEDPRPPVAIRITRPYGNEDEFLEHELDTLTRTSVTLLGAQPRPQGVVLRFELVLSSGQAILRGEGRVVGFKSNALNGLGGLTLRFTRLDSRSKTLVDKAASARERRRPSHAPPAPAASGPAVSSEPPPRPSAPPSEPPTAKREAEPRVSTPPPPSIRPEPSRAAPKPPAPPASSVQAPAARDELLERLRTRAKRLDATEVQRILSQRKRA